MPDSAAIEFRSETNRDTVVRVAVSSFGPDEDLGSLVVVIDADGVHAEREVLSYRGDGFDDFFRGLAADWRGWDGVRRWDAAENGLSIEATHHGSRVELLFILRRDYDSDAWELRAPIEVAPGEALTNLARAAGQLITAY